MDSNTIIVLYSAVYRLSLVASGLVCIILGYRLFVRGVFGASGKQTSTSIEGKGHGINLSVKSAAPGTCFALFGCVILVVMLFRGPEFTIEARTPAGVVTTKGNMSPNVTSVGGEVRIEHDQPPMVLRPAPSSK